MEKKDTPRFLALTILSISFLQTMTTSTVSPALGRIAGEFNTVAMSTIQLTMTVSSVCTIILSLVIGRLMAKFSMKSLLVFGIFLYLAGGIAGAFVSTIYQLIATRLVLGVGLGIFSPMITIAVSKYYSGIDRSRLMGYVQSANFLGGIVGTVYAGIVTGYGWRYIFWIYLFAAITLILTIIVYPQEMPQPRPSVVNVTSDEPNVAKSRIPFTCFGFGICMALYAMIFFKAPLTLAMYLPSIGITNSTTAGIAVGILYFFSFVAGLILVPLSRLLKRGVFSIAFLLMAIGYLVLNSSSDATMVFVATALLGFGSGILVPSMFAKVPEKVEGRYVPTTMIMVNCGMFLGIFLSPYVSVLTKAIGVNSFSFDYLTAIVLNILFAVIAYFLVGPNKKSEKGTVQVQSE